LSDDREVCIHESAHAVQTLAVGDDIVSISIAAGGGGLMRRRCEAWRGCPDPWHKRAIDRVAIDFAGAAGVCRLLGRSVETLATRSDFVALRAGGDFDNFYSFATVVCANNQNQIEAMRLWALRLADQTIERHWPTVTLLADCLLDRRELSGTMACTIIASTAAGRELLGIREPPVRRRDEFGRLTEYCNGRAVRIVTRPAR
jgi:hypothetical protein